MPSSDAPSQALSELARCYGVATEYWTFGGEHVTVPASTIRSVLTALQVDTSSEVATQGSLRWVQERPWRRVLPPVVVCREGWTPWVAVHLPAGSAQQVWLELEDGARRELRPVSHEVAPREVGGVRTEETTYELPGDLLLGWHTLHVTSPDAHAASPVVVTPRSLQLPDALAHRRAWGLTEQVYAVRSRRSWGIGDLADLADTATWAAADLGADFVLVNPLHAAEPVAPMEPSPYLPTTRRFANPVYIRVEDIPEVAYLSSAERQLLEWHGDDARALDDIDSVDRDAAWSAKAAALRMVFRQARTARRARAFTAYCEREGTGLQDFATWCALVGRYGVDGFPEELDDPHGPAVEVARAELADEVEFACWLQWVLEDQLAAAQRACTDAGMAIGVVHDLAVGVHPHGADAWGLGDALVAGVTVGAPPDAYNQRGQDWSQPPWRPDRLEELGYAPYRDMLRTVLRHAGGIRVDHVIGLFRLWWVPPGASAVEGTYVRYDHEALVGILALEAHRAGAVVIGEDLGNVEPWVRDYLRERGLLGTSILWFEQDGPRRPRPPEAYRELCMASVTTHDLPPTAGYLAGAHIDVRAKLGLLTRPVEVERAEDEADREAMLDVLRERGLLRPGGGVQETVEALHRYLSWTPAKMLGVSVSDLAGDTRLINQPGTDDEYPNWRLPLAGPDGAPVLLEALMASRWAKRLARCVAQR